MAAAPLSIPDLIHYLLHSTRNDTRGKRAYPLLKQTKCYNNSEKRVAFVGTVELTASRKANHREKLVQIMRYCILLLSPKSDRKNEHKTGSEGTTIKKLQTHVNVCTDRREIFNVKGVRYTMHGVGEYYA